QGGVVSGGQGVLRTVACCRPPAASDFVGEGVGAAHRGFGCQGGQSACHRELLVRGGTAQEGELLKADHCVRQVGTAEEASVGDRFEGGAGRRSESLGGGGVGVGLGWRMGPQETVEHVVVLHVLVCEQQQAFNRRRRG